MEPDEKNKAIDNDINNAVLLKETVGAVSDGDYINEPYDPEMMNTACPDYNEEMLKAAYNTEADDTTKEIADKLIEAAGTGVSSEAIDKAFDEMLATASSEDFLKKEEANTLSKEQIDEIADKLAEVRENNPVLQQIADMPSNNGQLEAAPNVRNYDDAETKTVKVEVDPESGANTILDGIDLDDDDDIEPADLSEYLDMESYDMDKIDLSKVELSDSIIKEYDIKAEEIPELFKVLQQYQSGDKDSPYYNRMPKGVQTFVDTMCIENGILNKAMRNTTTLTVISMIINEIAADKFQIDINDVIDKEIQKSGADMSSLYSDMIIGKKDKLYTAAAKVEDVKPDEAALLRKMGDACEESYMMTEFHEAIKNHKIRLKKFDVEKPSRAMTSFYAKYEKSSLGINDLWDITKCIPRHLGAASTPVTPDKITSKTVVAFTVLFAKYCMNMRSDSVTDHIFMYYFIKNILYLDALPTGDIAAQFGQDLIDRIKEILEDVHDVYGF
jgi:hypothetical protein